MELIKAPEEYYHNNKLKLFIAGGISNCPDWQSELTDLLKEEDIIIFNPRRDNFSLSKNDDMSVEQIKWEHKYLNIADLVSFWFPKETVCPITLYELGKYTALRKPILIGVHPKYERIFDVETQTKLEMPELKIVDNIYDLAQGIKRWVRERYSQK